MKKDYRTSRDCDATCYRGLQCRQDCNPPQSTCKRCLCSTCIYGKCQTKEGEKSSPSIFHHAGSGSSPSQPEVRTMDTNIKEMKGSEVSELLTSGKYEGQVDFETMSVSYQMKTRPQCKHQHRGWATGKNGEAIGNVCKDCGCAIDY